MLEYRRPEHAQQTSGQSMLAATFTDRSTRAQLCTALGRSSQVMYKHLAIGRFQLAHSLWYELEPVRLYFTRSC